MTETEFEKLYTETILRIEDALEASESGLDYETINDILTITCPDGSSIILTRQAPVQQLWMAARSGGYHFLWDEEAGHWRGTVSGRSLEEMLEEAAREQGAEGLSL